MKHGGAQPRSVGRDRDGRPAHTTHSNADLNRNLNSSIITFGTETTTLQRDKHISSSFKHNATRTRKHAQRQLAWHSDPLDPDCPTAHRWTSWSPYQDPCRKPGRKSFFMHDRPFAFSRWTGCTDVLRWLISGLLSRKSRSGFSEQLMSLLCIP
jgi:hypothetical protein